MPKCSKCSNYEETARFCGKCGAKISTDANVEPGDVFSIPMTTSSSFIDNNLPDLNAPRKLKGPALEEFPVEGDDSAFGGDEFLDNDAPEINFFDDEEDDISGSVGQAPEEDDEDDGDIFDLKSEKDPVESGGSAGEESVKLSPKEEKEAKKRAKEEEKKAKELEKKAQKALKAAQKLKLKEQKKKNRRRSSSGPGFFAYMICWLLFFLWVGGGCAFQIALHSSYLVWVMSGLVFFVPFLCWLVFRKKGFLGDLVLKSGFVGLMVLNIILLFPAYQNSTALSFNFYGHGFRLSYFSFFLFNFLCFSQCVLHYVFRSRLNAYLRFLFGLVFLYSLSDVFYGLAAGYNIGDFGGLADPLSVKGKSLLGDVFFYLSPHFLLVHFFLPFFVLSFGFACIAAPFKKRWNLWFTYGLFILPLIPSLFLFLYSFKGTESGFTAFPFLEPFYGYLRTFLSYIIRFCG
jgi:hypothetical protein